MLSFVSVWNQLYHYVSDSCGIIICFLPTLNEKHTLHLSIFLVPLLNSYFFLLHIVALKGSTNQHFQTATP